MRFQKIDAPNLTKYFPSPRILLLFTIKKKRKRIYVLKISMKKRKRYN